MKRYRKGQVYKPPSAADSAVLADTAEAHRRAPARPQDHPLAGQTIEVKTPAAGIPARDDDTIFWALCKRCVHVDDATANPAGGKAKLRVDTDEQLIVHNLLAQAIPGNSYVRTALTDTGIRCVASELGTARFIEFELAEALTTTDASASATVDAFYGGDDPDPLSAGITVYNKTASSNYIFEGDNGDKGMAVWDDVRERYNIWQMECP